MRAAIRKRYGGPEVINVIETDLPPPAADQIQVKVQASTVNRTDCANLTGQPLIMHFVLGIRTPRDVRIGVDFAGEIVAVGSAVTEYQVSDRIVGFADTGLGGQAEMLNIKIGKHIIKIPEGIDYVSAAAAVEGAHYAYSFIERADIRAGQKVLVNGATGAIGSALLQLIRPLDIHITGTADTEHQELIRSLGADETIDYTQTNFWEQNEKYDHIFDAVGKSRWGHCKPLLNTFGSYTSSELGPRAENPVLSLFSFWTRDKQVHFPIPYSTEKTLPYIMDALNREILTPVIDRVHSLSDIAEAYRYVMTGQKIGNVLIKH